MPRLVHLVLILTLVTALTFIFVNGQIKREKFEPCDRACYMGNNHERDVMECCKRALFTAGVCASGRNEAVCIESPAGGPTDDLRAQIASLQKSVDELSAKVNTLAGWLSMTWHNKKLICYTHQEEVYGDEMRSFDDKIIKSHSPSLKQAQVLHPIAGTSNSSREAG